MLDLGDGRGEELGKGGIRSCGVFQFFMNSIGDT
jgi:hypothetical protein